MAKSKRFNSIEELLSLRPKDSSSRLPQKDKSIIKETTLPNLEPMYTIPIRKKPYTFKKKGEYCWMVDEKDQRARDTRSTRLTRGE